jgi:hypothetical protein
MYIENLSNLRDWRENGTYHLGAIPVEYTDNSHQEYEPADFGIHPVNIVNGNPANPSYPKDNYKGFLNTWGEIS